jgi:hypothetical protein
MDRPILATIAGVMRSGLDLCLVVFPMADRATCGVFAAVGLVGLAWGIARRTWNLRATIAALGLGGLFAAGHVGYVASRVPRIDIVSSADRALHVWMFVATWALVAWGACRFLVARTWKGRVVGVALAVLNASCMVFVWLGWPWLFNTRAHSLLGEPLYNLRPGLLTLIGMAAIAIVAMVAFASARCVLGGVESAVTPGSDGLARQDERR